MFRLRSVTVLLGVAVIFFKSITVYKTIRISKCMTKTAGHTWTDYKTNIETEQELNTVG